MFIIVDLKLLQAWLLQAGEARVWSVVSVVTTSLLVILLVIAYFIYKHYKVRAYTTTVFSIEADTAFTVKPWQGKTMETQYRICEITFFLMIRLFTDTLYKSTCMPYRLAFVNKCLKSETIKNHKSH